MMTKLPGTPASDPINVRARELYEESLVKKDGTRILKPSWANASWSDRSRFQAIAAVELTPERDTNA